MAYFENYPITSFSINGKTFILVDLLRRFAFDEKFLNSELFNSYTVRESERPEDIAFRFYGDAELHWLILLANNIVNPYFDWPLPQFELGEYVKDKYGVPTAFRVRHYEKNGNVVGNVKEFTKEKDWEPPINPGPEDPKIFEVSFMDYEERLNDAKREIKIVRPLFVPTIIEMISANE